VFLFAIIYSAVNVFNDKRRMTKMNNGLFVTATGGLMGAGTADAENYKSFLRKMKKMIVKEILMEAGAANAENHKVFEEELGEKYFLILPENVAETIIGIIHALVEEKRSCTYIAKQSSALVDIGINLGYYRKWDKVMAQVAGMNGINSEKEKIDVLSDYNRYVYLYDYWKEFLDLSAFQEYIPDYVAEDVYTVKKYIEKLSAVIRPSLFSN